MRNILAATVIALSLLTAPTRADQLLGPGRIDAADHVILPGGPVLGLWQNRKFTSTPDKLTILGSGSTGDVSGMSVTPVAGAVANSLAAWLYAPTFPGLVTLSALSSAAPATARFAHAPTGNPLSTLTAFQLQGATVSGSQREFLGSIGLTATGGAGQDDSTGTGDKVSLYIAADQQAGAGNTWSLNTLVARQSGVTKSTTGYELDANNFDKHLGESLGTPGATARPFGYGLVVTGVGPYRMTGGIEIGGPGDHFVWNRGLVFNNNAVRQASIQDNTVSDISLDVRGGHQYPIDLANAGVVKAAIRLPLQQSIVAGNPDSNGARDDTGNIQLIGTDAGNNVRIATGGTLAIFGTTLLPAGTTQDIGSQTQPFRNAYLAGLTLTPYGPLTSSTPCAKGTITADASYIYVCISANRWRRSALADF